MGVLAVRKHEKNGSVASSLFSKQVDVGGKVYKLMIQIEKIRPKPCPRSKKSAYLAEARRLEQIRAGVAVAVTDRASIIPKKSAVCPICKEVYQSAQSLYLHKKKNHRHSCAICLTDCNTKINREKHEKLHASVDPSLPYKCHLCPEKFYSKREVGAHRRSAHSDVQSTVGNNSVKPMKRSTDSKTGKQIALPIERVCENQANDKIGGAPKKLQARTAGGYGDVTFTCRVCCKEFSSVEAAEAHTKDHTELVDEEYKCNICKKLFENDTILNEHLAEHLSRALRCPVCPKAFINRATLRIHMKSHGQV